MAVAFIIGGCGNVSHRLQFNPKKYTIWCHDCRTVIEATDGYYRCPDCDHDYCSKCARRLSLFFPTLTDAQVAAQRKEDEVAAQREEDEKTLIPCGGSSTHELKLLKQSPHDVFDKYFFCNVCLQEGDGELYHCYECLFNAHRECAEIPKRLKVFYHAHQLERVSAQPETCVSCNFCTKPIVKEFYVCKLCKFTVHPMCAMHPQKLWHVAHKHKLTLVPPSTQNMISCAGCNMLAPGFRYTCVPCDFNLHPSCAVLPPKPLCIFDGGHRVAIHSRQANFECAWCFKAGCSWSYICDEVHHVHMHLHCANDIMDSAAKVNMISEHLDMLMRKKVQIESSGNNQRSPSPTNHQQQRIQGATTSEPSAKVKTPAESETHVVPEMAENMRVRGGDAEAERKSAKEAEQREKAKSKADQDPKMDYFIQLLLELLRSRDTNIIELRQELVEKLGTVEETIGRVVHGLQTTQVHSKQRRVPRFVLCTEGVNMNQKLLTKLHIGIQAVQLHLLCEQPHKEHIVADATGCEINLMKGRRWMKLQPLLARGLQLVSFVGNVGGTAAGLGQIFPNLGKYIWEIKAVDLGKHSVQGRKSEDEQAVADALRMSRLSQEEEFAAQWLVSYLEEEKVVIHEAFGLYRVRHKADGSLAWLCSDHQSKGETAGTLESFPVRR